VAERASLGVLCACPAANRRIQTTRHRTCCCSLLLQIRQAPNLAALHPRRLCVAAPRAERPRAERTSSRGHPASCQSKIAATMDAYSHVGSASIKQSLSRLRFWLGPELASVQDVGRPEAGDMPCSQCRRRQAGRVNCRHGRVSVAGVSVLRVVRERTPRRIQVSVSDAFSGSSQLSMGLDHLR
jgi:hypothetical protein